jgi:hypothetical protein
MSPDWISNLSSLGGDDQLSVLPYERWGMISSVFVDNVVKNLSANQATPSVKVNDPRVIIKIPESFDNHLTVTSLTFHDTSAPSLIRLF